MELNLRYYGDKGLRTVCPPVEEFDGRLKQEAGAMLEMMLRERGIGLAAPQAGMSKRLIVALKMKDEDDNNAESIAMANPVVLERSKETWELEEGCLSVPGISCKVVRPKEIVVRYQDLDGESHTITAIGMFARVLLHEMDHLDGRLFVDLVSSAQKSLIKPALKSISEKYPSRS